MQKRPRSGTARGPAIAPAAAPTEGARRCPTCGRSFRVPLAAASGLGCAPPESFRPFCSKACKLADLGAWLDGRYRVPAPQGEAHDESGEHECR